MITLKRGDTFEITGTALQQVLDSPEELPLDLTGYTLRSQIRDQKDNLVDTLRVEITNHLTGEYALKESAIGVTQQWPLRRLYMDVEYESPEGVIVSTETVTIEVEKDITHAN